MFENNVLLNKDEEENTEYMFTLWSNKVDMHGPQRAARPLSWHIARAAIKAHALLGRGVFAALNIITEKCQNKM